jgi:hypothetical protein
MHELPEPVRPPLRRLARRLAIGLFVDVWAPLAVGSLLVAGLAALACRLFVPSAAPFLPWLLAVPLLAIPLALVVCFTRAYRQEEIVALADSLDGGQGLLLTLLERDDRRWAEYAAGDGAPRFELPRLRPWRRLAPLAPAAAFLAIVLWLPQRVPAPSQSALADDIAADLAATVVALKQQELITPDEEETLEEEIERIRRAADERVDSAAWEAADALREKMIADLAGKQDALKWAEDSLRRYAAAVQAGPGDGGEATTAAGELAEALEKLAKSGLLAGAPPALQRLLGGGKLPADAASLGELAGQLAEYLAEAEGRLGKAANLGKAFGRFDPAEFALESDGAADGDGLPGQGGVSRGRADAELTWGTEALPLDRFKAEALPPGSARSPDDWVPMVELPAAPAEAPVLSTPAAARAYAGSAGQTAWRRTLAPRHQSAVKKYFANDKH